jgi:hypothetical protein
MWLEIMNCSSVRKRPMPSAQVSQESGVHHQANALAVVRDGGLRPHGGKGRLSLRA